MSWLSSFAKRNKGVIRKIGKVVDVGADFLPIPGVRDVLNLGGKLMQGQNLKKAAIGTGLDYGVGRVIRGLGAAKGAVTGAKGAGTSIFPGLYGAGIPVAAAAGGAGVIAGVKRALGGTSVTDLLKGGATAYDAYGKQQDRSTANKRNDRDDARQARIDELNEADRIRNQGIEDTDIRLSQQDRQRKQKLEDERLQREQFSDARTVRLDDERLAREATALSRDTLLEDTDRATKETERLRQLGIFNQDRTADADWFNSLAPFRTQGAQGLLNPAKVDYSGIFAQPRALPRQIVTPDYAVLSAKRRPLNR